MSATTESGRPRTSEPLPGRAPGAPGAPGAPEQAPGEVGIAGPLVVRRARRDLDGGIVGGVAAGLAHHLAVPPLWVRAAFVVSTAVGGLGVILYGALWLMLPGRVPFETAAPGLESAARGGRRPGRIRRLTDAGPAIVLGTLGVGAIFVLEALFGAGTVVWPLAIAAVGVSLLWRQADETQRERLLDAGGKLDAKRILLGDGGWANLARVGAGALLIVVALMLVALRGGSLPLARDVTLAALLGVVGLVVAVGPWVVRLATELSDERAERVRTQDRADVAAHLHDSVLQTLALIQKNADDAGVVARLARAQERDLRSWLFVGDSTDEHTLAGALRAMSAEVEDAYGVNVDVVTVGDGDHQERLRPIVAATREAVQNAARHAGVARVDVYAEVTADAVDVYVRDRGTGFDPDAVPADRYGVRRSILDRMQRHGGTAEVRSAPGAGTEVRLHQPGPGARAAAAQSAESGESGESGATTETEGREHGER